LICANYKLERFFSKIRFLLFLKQIRIQTEKMTFEWYEPTDMIMNVASANFKLHITSSHKEKEGMPRTSTPSL
jgi:hypothetical protein